MALVLWFGPPNPRDPRPSPAIPPAIAPVDAPLSVENPQAFVQALASGLPRVSPDGQPVEQRDASDEPAGLPPCPAPRAQREQGYQRSSQGITEHVSHWNLPGTTPKQVMDHYRQAALARGFRPVESPMPSSAATAPASRANAVFLRSFPGGEPSQTLVIRVWPAEDGTADGCRAMIWLSHASGSR